MIKLDGAMKFLNIQQDWKSAKRSAADAREEASFLLAQNEQDEKELRRDNAEKKGKNLSQIGASGVMAASFNDALFYNDLKTEQEADFNKKKAQSEAARANRRAKAEKKAAKLKYSMNLLNEFL